MADVAHSGNNRDNEDEGDDRPEPDREETLGRKNRRKKKQRSFWKELPILIGVALLLALLIQTFLARVFVIPSESMEQTLHGCAGCYGDRVLVDKLVFNFGEPEPGEVVVFERPDTWNQSEFRSERSSNAFVSWLQDIGAAFGLASPDEDDVVKRVVAVGGQTVECCDEQNRVLVDGRPLDEPYIYWAPGSGEQEQFPPINVPDGYLWVLGDNRNNSCDSRCQGGGGRNGLVPVDNVIGKARYIVLPPSRWQGVGDHDPQVDNVALSFVLPSSLPLGVGLVAAWPTLWLGRRVRNTVKSIRSSESPGSGDKQ
ncbi:signal peptidase I [Actinophytocola gossypii]|uniref:Signal peptidase I n=1 Tax=Actinophytocola gossypii TaxID=2812003 RepID=A0ABT2JA28_9PSEU|nr:signal peptidase I [Actinophytocola gossypii]MCT2584722.1 signal peptidase I [Actinophytocola gossypii]